MDYVKAFIVGGLICVAAQILIDKTPLTSARIMTLFVVIGCFLGALGLYEKLVDFAGAGATTPIIGFGNSLAKGTIKAVAEKGFMGIFTGGLGATAGGIVAALFLSSMAGFFVSSKEK
jgi:stage V sporulation protein AE